MDGVYVIIGNEMWRIAIAIDKCALATVNTGLKLFSPSA